MTLDDILEPEGGVVISRSMVKHLTSRSHNLPSTVLVDVLRLLMRYEPGSDQERLDIMNRLDWLLASPQPHLVEAALQLYFHLCSGELCHLRADAVARAAAALCRPADATPPVRWLTLELVRRLGPEHHPAFSPHYRYFVPRPSDGGALSLRLVQFVWRLAGPDRYLFTAPKVFLAGSPERVCLTLFDVPETGDLTLTLKRSESRPDGRTAHPAGVGRGG
ncbi:AP-4 complex subunit beta-1-like [Pollicipes pollicipes]|uniref:AP-4 complex subunit beta-1-like n=1 Tax=Pollicipes pollicipes TaxID=41117 RepID=UPI001884C992|nr:AP-4 complex subunit beta-1-like [Pollicipes pollicipes]